MKQTKKKQHSHSLKQDIAISALLSIGLTTLSYIAGLLFGWITLNSINILEALAVVTMYSCTYLSIQQRRINYTVGAVSAALYAILFLHNGLLASAILSIYRTPTLLYGWIRWGKDHTSRPVTHVSLRSAPLYLLVTLTLYAGGVYISTHLGGSMAWTDAVILAATILAQFLLDNKKIETWIVWALVNIFALYTYASSGLPLVVFQYVFLLGNTVFGYYTWKRHVSKK